MSALTNKYAIPYAVPTDAPANFPALMQTMAERLDLLQGEVNSTTINVAAANTTYTVRVNYSRAYTGLGPRAFLSLLGAQTGPTVVWASAQDDTGFTLGVRSTVAAGNTVIQWKVQL